MFQDFSLLCIYDESVLKIEGGLNLTIIFFLQKKGGRNQIHGQRVEQVLLSNLSPENVTGLRSSYRLRKIQLHQKL